MIIQRRIQLDEVEGSDQTAVMQEFHDQMRFVESRTAWNRRADGAGYRGVEEIDIEADMQVAVFGRNTIEEARQRRLDPMLVDRAHIIDFNPKRCDQFALCRID